MKHTLLFFSKLDLDTSDCLLWFFFFLQIVCFFIFFCFLSRPQGTRESGHHSSVYAVTLTSSRFRPRRPIKPEGRPLHANKHINPRGAHYKIILQCYYASLSRYVMKCVVFKALRVEFKLTSAEFKYLEREREKR